eukprot:scaffold830_cov377-Prasinococcus_capsulatus_cf.AAC.9
MPTRAPTLLQIATALDLHHALLLHAVHVRLAQRARTYQPAKERNCDPRVHLFRGMRQQPAR